MARFFILFVAIMAVLFRIDMLDSVQTAFVQPWTSLLARISAALVMPFDHNVISHGRILQSNSNGFAVSIEAGCNGVEAAIVLMAAIIAFPSRWKDKIVGIVTGIVAVQLVNLVRIISLFYLGQWSFQAFEFAHLYLWQALIMLDVLVVWLLWLRWVSAREARHADQ